MPSQKGSLPILALLLIVIVLAAGAFYFSRNLQTPPPPQPTPTQPQPTASQMGLKFDNPPLKYDPFNDKNGPFYHQVFLAKSPDGLNFTKESDVLFDKASVPDMVALPNGRLLAYMVDGAGRSKSGVMVALSDDEGISWDQGSLQLKRKSAQPGGIADPQIIYYKNGTFRLYYLVFGPGKNSVKSATSTDGINFEEEDGTRFEYPRITDPDIVNFDGKWFMYLSQGPKLIAASSDDGLTFKLEKTIREKGSVTKTVYVDVNFYRQFYCSDGNIKSAKTADGLNFTDEPGDRLTSDPGQTICDPAPVHQNGAWLMLYKVAPGH